MDAGAESDRPAAAGIVVQPVLEVVVAVRQRSQGRAGHPLSVVKGVLHLSLNHCFAVSLDHLLKPRRPHEVSCRLGVEVSPPLLRGADVSEHEFTCRLIEPSLLIELDGRDYESLLEEFFRQRHGTWRRSSYVGVVGPRCHEGDQPLTAENR